MRVCSVEQLKSNGLHTLTHEYVHAGASMFMKNHRDHVASKRIADIFSKVTHKRYASVFVKHGVDNDYWRTNVDEFLAEALSNPKVMLALQDIKLTYDGTLAAAFKWIVDAALRLLGINKGSSAYAYVLDGFAAIMEAQKVQNVSEAKDPKVLKPSVDVMEIIAKTVPEFTEHVDADTKVELQKINDETPELLVFALNTIKKGCL